MYGSPGYVEVRQLKQLYKGFLLDYCSGFRVGRGARLLGRSASTPEVTSCGLESNTIPSDNTSKGEW